MANELPKFRLVTTSKDFIARTDVYLNGVKVEGVVGIVVETPFGCNPRVKLEILAAKVEVESAPEE